MQAAIGRIQLRKLPDWVAKRRANAAVLIECLQSVRGLRVLVPSPSFGHSYYKFYVYLEPQKLKPNWDQLRIMNAIRAEGIPCFTGSCSEIYRERAFRDAKLGPQGRLPNAQQLGERSLMFLVHPTLGEREMKDTCRAVTNVMAQAVVPPE